MPYIHGQNFSAHFYLFWITKDSHHHPEGLSHIQPNFHHLKFGGSQCRSNCRKRYALRAPLWIEQKQRMIVRRAVREVQVFSLSKNDWLLIIVSLLKNRTIINNHSLIEKDLINLKYIPNPTNGFNTYACIMLQEFS